MVAALEGVHHSTKMKRDIVKYVDLTRDIDDIIQCDNLYDKYAPDRSQNVEGGGQPDFREIQFKQRVSEAAGDFHKWSPETEQIVLVSPNSKFSIDESSEFQFFMQIFDPSGALTHRVKVEEQRGFGALTDQKMLLWIDEGIEPKAWGFQFQDQETLLANFEVINRCSVEQKQKQSFSESAKEDEKWAKRAAAYRYVDDDVEMEDVGGHQEAADEEEEEQKQEYQDAQGDDDFDYDHFRETKQAFQYDREFMLRGDVVQVYSREQEHGRPVYESSFPVMKDSDSSVITPYGLTLQNSESNLIFANENDQKSIYDFDLETGKIIQKFTGGDRDIVQLSNPFKNGQTQPDNILTAISDNAVMLLDKRLNNTNKVAKEKAYKSPVNFISVGVTMQGGFATGSLNGEIRLYKEVGQIAKTLFPGLGEPILHLECSADSKWLLATCQTYLLLIDTQFEEDKLGFTHRMGQNKPEPIKLSLKA